MGDRRRLLRRRRSGLRPRWRSCSSPPASRHPLLRQSLFTAAAGRRLRLRSCRGWRQRSRSSANRSHSANSAVLPRRPAVLTFGSGLVIVPFLEQGLVQQYGWLDPAEFLIAVAIGMISPGPVVITATFVGFLVAGFWGSLVSTIGIFLPSFMLILVVAPILMRHRANRNVARLRQRRLCRRDRHDPRAPASCSARSAIGDWLTIPDRAFGCPLACRSSRASIPGRCCFRLPRWSRSSGSWPG